MIFVSGMSIDWPSITSKLPSNRTDEEKEIRRKIFKEFDTKENGYLTLTEAKEGILSLLKLDEKVFDLETVVKKAYDVGKVAAKAKKGDFFANNYIEWKEFRFFLSVLRQYLEYWVAFTRVDENDDKKINLDEFKANQEIIEKWVGKIDAEEEFKKIDANQGGSINFQEFIDWATKKSLDLEDDDD